MGQDKCAYCNCQAFEKNPFSPGKCASCLHNHTKPAGSSSPATSSPALKSTSTPTTLSKSSSQSLINTSSPSLNSKNPQPPATPPPNKNKKPPPVPGAASVSSPNV